MLLRSLAAGVLVLAAAVDCRAQDIGVEEAAIRRQLAGYADARARREPRAEAMYYAGDADFRAADGTKAKGRDQIVLALVPPPNSNSRFGLVIETVRFVNVETAIVDGIATPSGNYATYVMVKRAGTWLIGAARIALASPAK